MPVDNTGGDRYLLHELIMLIISLNTIAFVDFEFLFFPGSFSSLDSHLAYSSDVQQRGMAAATRVEGQEVDCPHFVSDV